MESWKYHSCCPLCGAGHYSETGCMKWCLQHKLFNKYSVQMANCFIAARTWRGETHFARSLLYVSDDFGSNCDMIWSLDHSGFIYNPTLDSARLLDFLTSYR